MTKSLHISCLKVVILGALVCLLSGCISQRYISDGCRNDICVGDTLDEFYASEFIQNSKTVHDSICIIENGLRQQAVGNAGLNLEMESFIEERQSLCISVPSNDGIFCNNDRDYIAHMGHIILIGYSSYCGVF